MANGNDEDRRFLRKLNCNYLVLDEGHMLKNMQSQRYQGLMRMKVRCRASFTDGEGWITLSHRIKLSPLDSAIGVRNSYSLDSDLSGR